MASIFKLRRGSGSVSLETGELYVNYSSSLQYADESDVTRTLIPLDKAVSGTIKLSGSIELSGSITASDAYIHNNLYVSGNLYLGNQTSDTITATGEFNSHLVPNPTRTWDLGSDGKWWRNLYANTISASFISGSIAGIGNINEFSESVDFRLDTLELSASLYDNAMSGSLRLYVSPSGSDSTIDGSDPHRPFRTIKAAVESLGAAEYTNTKRYTIIVGSGNYTEQNPIVVPPGVSIVGDTLRTVRLTASNPTKDFFHCHDSNYFYGLRFLDLKYPAFAFSFPSSAAKANISGGSVSSISIVHSMTGYTDGNNQDIGIIIEGPDVSGSIATATANIAGGVITQINVTHGGTNYGANEKPHISIPAPLSKRPVITTSPYVQNCSSITGPFNTSGVKVLEALPYDEATFNIDEQGAGGGIRIDGNLVHPISPLESFVADAFTQVNQGGPGHLVINKGYAQFVSCFTTFCTYGFKTANGGFANISNSVIDFGKEGLVAKTYFPTTYNTGSSLETKTSTVSGFVIDENGAGYVGPTAAVTITGGGASVQATAEATVNANGSIEEIVLLTPGSGYTSEPNVSIAAPTGPGAIQATTVAGKALISGVTEMLISLETGVRGVDISSNMILNGVDYLVTDVAKVTGQPNQRRVTTFPAPPSIDTGDIVKFHQLSNISTGGLVMEYVGSGVTYNALPKFGGVPIRTREIIEIAPGRVFYSTVDNIGNIKIGDYFAVNQLTGEVTINANSFNLSGLNAIGPFKRNGVAVGVVLQEVSNNTTLLNSQGLYGEDTVPTQYAVKGYIDPISASLDGRLDLVETTSSYLNTTFSTSVDARLDLVEATASYLNNAFSISVDSRLDLMEEAAVLDDSRLDALEAYSASLKTAISASGQDLIVYGNLTVQGTQTSLNVNEVFIEDKTLTLASGSTNAAAADGAGIHIAGANVTMSWDNNNSRINLNTSLYVSGELSGSTLNGVGNVTTFSTSVDSRFDTLENFSSSIFNAFSISVDSRLDVVEATASLYVPFSTSVDARLDVVEATASLYVPFSTSVNSRLNSLQSYTASVSTSVGLLQSTASYLNTTFSTSVDARLDSIELYTGSVSTSVGLLESTASYLNTTFSTSVDARLDAIEISTASLNNWTGSTFVTFSTSVDSRIDLTEATSSYLNTTFSTSVDARLDGLEIESASFRTFTASVFQPFSTSVDARLDGVEYTASLFGGGLIAQLNTLNNATASLQNFSASINTWTGSTFVTFSTSVDSRLDDLELFSSSLDATFATDAQLTALSSAIAVTDSAQDVLIASLRNNILSASVFTSFSTSVDARLDTLEATTFSTSVDARLDAIEASTSSLSAWTGSTFVTFSTSVDSRMDVVEASASLYIPFSTSVDSRLDLLEAGGGFSVSDTTGQTGIDFTKTGTSISAVVSGLTTSSDVRFNSIGVGMDASATPGRIDASNDVVAFSSSDIRFKQNIQPIENALNKIEIIGGYEFDWNSELKSEHGYEGHDIGVIAQEIEKIAPELVTTRENGYKAVKYEKIVPILIQAIKELSAKVDSLENK